MLDIHMHPQGDWGLLPVLFHIGNLPITSYAVFMFLSLLVGFFVYVKAAKKEKHNMNKESTLMLAVGAFIGGVLGAKLPIWIFYFQDIISSFPNIMPFLSGRTITGGIIGGMIGVIIMKKKLGIHERRGNLFAPTIALGVAIGRIGCFLAGCCYGIATTLPWGVNFGDGILRHPTQLYEALFMLLLFFYLTWRSKQTPPPRPGILFSTFIYSYFTFRFFIEFIRVEPKIFLGLTLFQYISLAAIGWFLIKDYGLPRMKKR